MKRRMINLFIAVSTLFVFIACSNEEDSVQAIKTGICLNIKTGGNTRSSVVPGTDPENEIKKMSIWLFSNELDDVTTKRMFKEISAPSSEEIVISENELKSAGMSSDGTYYVYVVANLPSGILNENSTLQELRSRKLQTSLRPGVSGEGLCMSGYTKVANNFGQYKAVDIYLSRLVSRLDITIKNETGDAWTVDKISVKDDQKQAFVFATDDVQEPVLFDSPQDIVLSNTSDDEQSYSVYVYENMSTTPMKIRVESTIGTEKFNWETSIMINGSAKLERNTVCKATLKLKYTDVAIDCEVESVGKWEENIIENSIDNLNLQFDKEQVILSEYGGAVLTVTTNAKEITVDASQAQEVIASGNVAVENGNCVLLLSMSDLIKEKYEGLLRITAGTVSKTIKISKPESSFWFEFTPDPQYPDGYNFPWYFTYDPAIKTGKPFSFTFNMNIMAWVRYELYEERPEGEHLTDYIAPEDAIKIPIGSTSYLFDLYDLIGANYTDYKWKLVIYVGYLDSYYGPTAKTLTYTIDKTTDWTLPK